MTSVFQCQTFIKPRIVCNYVVCLDVTMLCVAQYTGDYLTKRNTAYSFFPKGTGIISTGINSNSRHSIKVSSSPYLTLVKLVRWQ